MKNIAVGLQGTWEIMQPSCLSYLVWEQGDLEGNKGFARPPVTYWHSWHDNLSSLLPNKFSIPFSMKAFFKPTLFSDLEPCHLLPSPPAAELVSYFTENVDMGQELPHLLTINAVVPQVLSSSHPFVLGDVCPTQLRVLIPSVPVGLLGNSFRGCSFSISITGHSSLVHF